MEKKQLKVVIIGGGHNALTAAGYLARAGHRVTVVEKRSDIGGCASTDVHTFPGYKISSASYLNSLFLPEIVRDLELEKYGYEVLPRNPSSFTPLVDGRYLMLGSDREFTQREIAKFSKKDAEMYPHYEEVLGELAEWVAKLMRMTPPALPPKHGRDFRYGRAFLGHARNLSFKQLRLLAELGMGNPLRYLDKWFESDVLKSTLLTDALIGSVEPNGYVLLHHVMGEAGGARGVWGYMRGGMGSIPQALRKSAEQWGAKVYCNCSVERIVVGKHDRRVTVRGSDGSLSSIAADIVISSLDPLHTFVDLLGHDDRVKRERKKALRTDYRSGVMKINCILSGLPNFRSFPGITPGPQHQGTIHLAPSTEYLLRALREYKEGKASDWPMLELSIPSVVDHTLAPPGHHVVNIFAQFVPYECCRDEKTKCLYFERHIRRVLDTYISNIDDTLKGVQIFSPYDLEREFGLTGGNIFHGALNPGQLFSLRAQYRTGLRGVYLCGSGTHPGGGVSGAPGYNAAREVLCDIAEGLF